MPKFSIITINLNNASGLHRTIKSVVNQSFQDYEYIMIDGGSTDSSIDIIKEYAGNLAYWVSEPDSGIYNAMNKGIRQAQGEYCMFLNSGDILADPDILEKCFTKRFSEEIAYCNIITTDRKGLTYRKFPAELTFYYFFTDSIGHPSSFIKRDLFHKIGFYNEKLKIVSDWEFFLKAIMIYNCSLCHLDEYLVIFNTLGISSNSYVLHGEERALVLEELFPRFIPDYKKLVQLSEYIHIQSGNKLIRKLVGFINNFLAWHHREEFNQNNFR